MQYAIVIERAEGSFGAYVPDLPGCVAVGETEAEARDLIVEAIAFHIESMEEDGEAVPEPNAHVEYVTLARAA